MSEILLIKGSQSNTVAGIRDLFLKDGSNRTDEL